MKRLHFVKGLCFAASLVLALFFLWGCGKRAATPGPEVVAVEDRMYAIAEVFYKKGDYENALLQYRAYVAKYPRRALSADALMKMASIHIALGRYQNARALYQHVLDDYSGSTSAENARVEILATYYQQGDYTDFFEKVAALDVDTLPRTALLRLYKLMGDAYLYSGQIKAAVDAYARSLSFYPVGQRTEVMPEMTVAIEALGIEEIDELLAGPEYLPKARLMYQLGQRNMTSGWNQAALDTFSELLSKYPAHELAGEVGELIALIERRAAYDQYSLGCLLPLTGPYSSYGRRALNGVELALDRFRLNHPEVPIRLMVKDTAASESQTIQAVRDLDAARVAAILGPIVMAKQAAEEAQRIGIPIITLSQKDGVTDVGEYVFRNYLTPQTQVDTIVSYLTETLGLNRFAILYPDEKYGSTFMNLFWDRVIDHGGVVTGCESYPGDVTDFKDPIKKLVGLHYEMPENLKAELVEAARPLPDEFWRLIHPSVFQNDYAERRPWFWEQFLSGGAPVFAGINVFMLGDGAEELLTGEGDYRSNKDAEPEAIVDFDALFIPDSPKKTGLIVPQLAYYDVEDVYFVGTNLWHSDELIQMARRYLQNSLLTDGFFAESSLPLVREFVDRYESVYDMQPGFIDAVAYDTAGILFDVVSRPDVMFRSAIRRNLAGETPFDGVTGPTVFLESGEVEKQPYLLQVRGRRFRVVAQP
jgi:ABC-type branched-subunit amino acid transport system substrate-binding protein/thioredoxin-like negative regulator of GroEL